MHSVLLRIFPPKSTLSTVYATYFDSSSCYLADGSWLLRDLKKPGNGSFHKSVLWDRKSSKSLRPIYFPRLQLADSVSTSRQIVKVSGRIQSYQFTKIYVEASVLLPHLEFITAYLVFLRCQPCFVQDAAMSYN